MSDHPSDVPFEQPESLDATSLENTDPTATKNNAEDVTLIAPKSLSFGMGGSWIAHGFGLFTKSIGLWIAITLAWSVVVWLSGLIPVIGSLIFSVLSPVFAAGYLLGCHELEEGRKLRFGHLFAGFSNNVGQLILVGVLYMVGIVIAILPALMFMEPSISALVGTESAASMFSVDDFITIALGLLLSIALMTPVFMGYWFAPALVVFHDQSATEAMLSSFKGCLRNMGPFLLYGIILGFLSVLSVIPMGLGLIVLIPVIHATLYASYRTIFTE